MKSIIQNDEKCYFCGVTYTLEMHHCFPGANRKLSERDGLKVWLCHNCHNEPPLGVHHNKARMIQLKKVAEQRWLKYYGKTVEDFLERYGRDYLWIDDNDTQL